MLTIAAGPCSRTGPERAGCVFVRVLTSQNGQCTRVHFRSAAAREWCNAWLLFSVKRLTMSGVDLSE